MPNQNKSAFISTVPYHESRLTHNFLKFNNFSFSSTQSTLQTLWGHIIINSPGYPRHQAKRENLIIPLKILHHVKCRQRAVENPQRKIGSFLPYFTFSFEFCRFAEIFAWRIFLSHFHFSLVGIFFSESLNDKLVLLALVTWQ